MSADIPSDIESTVELLARHRNGDGGALGTLFARYVPILRRWASGRLPRSARQMTETGDIVQETVLQTFKNIENFDNRGEGALLGYMRQALMNRIRDELRRSVRRGPLSPLDTSVASEATSPYEAAVGTETAERYEAALARLSPDEREAIVARVELGLTYQEMAAALGKVSSDAARMAVGRALVRLAQEMGHGRRAGS